MSDNKWVYEVATGKWMIGFRDPAIYLTDSVNYALADLGEGARWPDPILERYDPGPTKRRAATAPEIAASEVDQLAATSRLTSRRKDILATCALSVRTRGIAAWNGMTVQQKKDATLAEADVWASIREFVEKNT